MSCTATNDTGWICERQGEHTIHWAGDQEKWKGTNLDWERMNRVCSMLMLSTEDTESFTIGEIAEVLRRLDIEQLWIDLRVLVQEEELLGVTFRGGRHRWHSRY